MSDDEDAPAAEEGAPAWMATFGDMMSLLLTFFILLLSFANMDVIKFSAAVGSLRDAFGTVQMDPGELEAKATSLVKLSDSQSSPVLTIIESPAGSAARETELLRRLEQMIQANNLDKLVDAEKTPRGVVIRVRGQLLFDPGSARLRPGALLVLDEIAAMVNQVPNDVSIEGHTDDSPIATREFPSNWHLSADRAIAALEYLISAASVEATRLNAAGFAHMKPLVPNDGPENRDENRRVEFVFLRPNAPEKVAAVVGPDGVAVPADPEEGETTQGQGLPPTPSP